MLGRFIPTCVGNTLTPALTPVFATVHPHMCGEHIVLRPFSVTGAGSSPHVWGTRRFLILSTRASRFIPTCVGNTMSVGMIETRVTVHPHMCGEHCFFVLDHHSHRGSSPHVWGTLFSIVTHNILLRFIPTCVGNTLLC